MLNNFINRKYNFNILCVLTIIWPRKAAENPVAVTDEYIHLMSISLNK